MSDKYFIDTNILLYSFDNASPSKREIAHHYLREMQTSDSYIISTQVLHEFSSAASKKLKPPLENEKITMFISSFRDEIIEVPDKNTTIHALAIQKRYGYSFYDCLILATAIEASCTICLSEDMQHGQRIDTLELRNPFLL